ncbi:MAG: DMT family transporter [Patescibacteria group bacterium]
MKTTQRSHSKGILLILLSALLLGSYGVWSRLLGDSFDGFSQGWIRSLLVCIILLPIVLYKKQLVSIKRKDWKWLTVFLIAPSVTQAPIFYAFNNMDIGTATLLLFVSLLITMYVVGFFFLKEKVSSDKLFSLGLAIVGLLLIFSFSLEKFSLLPAAMASLVGIASGLQVSFSKKLSSSYSAFYLSFLSWLVIIPSHGLAALWFGEQHIPPLFDITWIYLLGYAFAGLFAFLFYIIGLKYIEASAGGLIGLTEIIFGILFGILFFGEILTVRILVGAFLVITAAALPDINDFVRQRKRRKKN